MSDKRTSDATLIAALRILASEIQSQDGLANACIAEAADRLAELVEERRWVPVGDIIDMEYSGELGVYYGTIRCPACDQDVSVCPMEDRPKCRCGIQWDFSVSAVGEQPLPTGPEGEE